MWCVCVRRGFCCLLFFGVGVGVGVGGCAGCVVKRAGEIAQRRPHHIILADCRGVRSTPLPPRSTAIGHGFPLVIPGAGAP